MTRALTPLLAGGSFFEGPRWRDGRWWVSDFYRHGIFTVNPDGTETQVAEVSGQPSGLGWLPDGTLLAVSMKDHRVLRVAADGATEVHAEIPDVRGPCNDMVVSATGHAYVGSFGFDLMTGEDPAASPVWCVGPDGLVRIAADGLHFPNGSLITPDGSTLIVGETIGCRYTAFAIGADGELTDRRVWAQMAPTPPLDGSATIAAVTVAPDGCALDAEDHIWSADALGNRVIRIAPGGAIVEEIAAPEGLGAYACMLGGDDGRTLLICCAPDFFEHSRSAARDAVLVTTTVEVPHAGLP